VFRTLLSYGWSRLCSTTVNALNKRPREDAMRRESTALNHAGPEALPTCCEPGGNHF